MQGSDGEPGQPSHRRPEDRGGITNVRPERDKRPGARQEAGDRHRWTVFRRLPSAVVVQRSPRTSCIVYRPGGCVTTHWAARNAPWAKVSRLEALWVNSRRSPFAAKMTV